MTIVATTPHPASRLQFAGEETDLGVKYLVMSLWPNLEIARWQFNATETRAFPVADGMGFVPIVANPGDSTTLWTDGAILYFGATPIAGGGGAVSGSGAAGQLTYWTGVSTISGEAALTYDAGANLLTAGSMVRTGDGDVTSPSYSFTADSSSGLYSIAAGTVGVATTGVLRLSVMSTAMTSAVLGIFPASTNGASGYASIRLPHGVAPTTNLTNGDVWTTTSGMFARINGATIGPFNIGGGTIGGTIASTQVAYGVGADSISGDAGLTYDAGTDTLSVGAQILLGVGSVGAPSYAFTGDTNTGIYNIGADQLGIATGGTLRLSVANAVVTSTVLVVAPTALIGQDTFVYWDGSTFALGGAEMASSTGLAPFVKTVSTRAGGIDNGLAMYMTSDPDGILLSGVISMAAPASFDSPAQEYTEMYFLARNNANALVEVMRIRGQQTQIVASQNGTASLPTWSWSGDISSGMYLVSFGTVGFSVGAVQQLSITSTLATFRNDVTINGKLTVAGLIDPTGLALTPVAANPGGGLATSTIWVNSADSNKLYFGAAAMGMVGGSGTTNQMAYWTSSSAVGSSSGFTVNTGTNSLRALGSLLAGDGTLADVGIGFGADVDTGLYRSAANTLELVAGGTSYVTLASGIVTTNYAIIAPVGAAGAVSYGLGSGTLGMYRATSSSVGFSSSGVLKFEIGGNNITSSVVQIFKTSNTTSASWRAPHGAAPSVPVNGDFWTTTSGLFGYINGSAVAYGAGTITGSGTANQVAYFSGTSALTSDTGFLYNGTTVTVASKEIVQTGAVGLSTGTGAILINGVVLIATPVNVLTTVTSAATSTAVNVTTDVARSSGGAVAAGYGVINAIRADSSTNSVRTLSDITSTWVVPTTGSTTARTVFNVYDTVAREGMRLEATGSAAMIGFLGASAIVRPVGTTDLRVALINLGLYTTGGASPLDLNGGTFNTTGIAGIGIASSSTTFLNTGLSTTGVSSLRMGHGTAPSSPVNGDFWTTTAGLFGRINGATVSYGGGTVTGSGSATALGIWSSATNMSFDANVTYSSNNFIVSSSTSNTQPTVNALISTASGTTSLASHTSSNSASMAAKMISYGTANTATLTGLTVGNNVAFGATGGPTYIFYGKLDGLGSTTVIHLADSSTEAFQYTTSIFRMSLPMQINAPTAASTSSQALRITPGAHTALSATTEYNSFLMQGVTQTWSASPITTQRYAVFEAPTWAFASASTITNGATLAIAGAPIAGTNATISNKYALWTQAGTNRMDSSWTDTSGAVVRFGLAVAMDVQPTGASTSNFVGGEIFARSTSASGNINGPAYGGRVYFQSTGAVTHAEVYGLAAFVTTSAGTTTSGKGVDALATCQGGTLTLGIALNAQVTQGGGTFTTGVAINIPASTGTIGTVYAIRQLGASDLNSFAGNVSITGQLYGFLANVVTEAGTTFTFSQATHGGRIVITTNGSAVTATVPSTLPVGFNCTLIQSGGGQVNVVAGAGATVANRSSQFFTAAASALCMLAVPLTTGVAVFGGDTA